MGLRKGLLMKGFQNAARVPARGRCPLCAGGGCLRVRYSASSHPNVRLPPGGRKRATTNSQGRGAVGTSTIHCFTLPQKHVSLLCLPCLLWTPSPPAGLTRQQTPQQPPAHSADLSGAQQRGSAGSAAPHRAAGRLALGLGCRAPFSFYSGSLRHSSHHGGHATQPDVVHQQPV